MFVSRFTSCGVVCILRASSAGRTETQLQTPIKKMSFPQQILLAIQSGCRYSTLTEVNPRVQEQPVQELRNRSCQ
jgi:hypothetical protein